MEALLEMRFRDNLFKAAFSWFSVRPQSVVIFRRPVELSGIKVVIRE